MSRWAIGELLVRLEPLFRGKLEPSLLSGYTGPPRPADTSLNCSKLQARLDFPLPRFTDWIAEQRSLSQTWFHM